MILSFPGRREVGHYRRAENDGRGEIADEKRAGGEGERGAEDDFGKE